MLTRFAATTLLFFALYFAQSAWADTFFSPVPTVTVDSSSGAYTITATPPTRGGDQIEPASPWIFSGSVGVPVTELATTAGVDAIGQYKETSFHWKSDHPYIGRIRTYPGRPGVYHFLITSVDPLTGPTPDFPAFTTFPAGLHHFSFQDERFSPHSFSLQHGATPWVLFDDHATTAVLSGASDYLVTDEHGDGNTLLASGLLPTIESVPAGFTHESMLAVGTGIEATIHAWGDALTALSGKAAPSDDSDPVLKYFGYWTDHGATYYYNYDQDKGYAGTILAVHDEFNNDHIPLHYLQLDSWWYQKSYRYVDGSTIKSENASLPAGNWNVYGGTMDYSAAPALFPDGLKAFDQQLGLPLVVHNRWIDPSSPYHAAYQFSGVAAIDPRWWDDRAKYLADSGVTCYEQDWLNNIYIYSPQMSKDTTTGAAFTDNMARATKANGETIQYCMATPRFFLQGSKYSNLTTIRTSDDRFNRNKWDNFVYTSVFADALHIRPWCDTFMSSELGNLILATLSTGPVGVGDKMGAESVANIKRVIRADGQIIKPDAPMMPTDATILADANHLHQPLIASTYTDNGQKTIYVFAFTRQGDSSSVTFTPASFGLTGDVYITSLAGTAVRQKADQEFDDTLDSTGWNYYMIAPVGKSGITFFGDQNAFVGTGQARIQSIKDDGRGVAATILFAPNEGTVTVQGYSPTKPKFNAPGSQSITSSYDPTTQHFSLQIINSPGSNSAATVRIQK